MIIICSVDVANEGRLIDEYPLKNVRFVRLQGLPSYGPCALCGSGWDNSKNGQNFFDGLPLDRDFTNLNQLNNLSPVDPGVHHLHHMGAMLSTIKLPWIAQFIRFIFRPKIWFVKLLQEIASNGLIGPSNERVTSISRPFISLHVRYEILDPNL